MKAGDASTLVGREREEGDAEGEEIRESDEILEWLLVGGGSGLGNQ